MRIISLLTISLLTVNVSLGQSDQNISTGKASLKTNAGALQELATPTSLSIDHSIFGAHNLSLLLAPQSGSEFVVSLNQTQLDISSATSTSKYNMSIGTLAIAYALGPQFFIGTNLSYGQNKGTSEYTYTSGVKDSSESSAKGVVDPVINVGTRINSGKVSTLLALGASLKSGDSEIDVSNSSSTSNLKNGGSAIIPSVSIFSNSKSEVMTGVSISYAVMQDRTLKSKYSDGQSATWIHRGNNLQNISLFAEGPEAKNSFGASLNYMKTESGTSTGEGYQSTSDAFASTTVNAFMKIAAAKNLALIPSIAFGRFGEGAGDLTKKEIYSAGLMGKATF